MSGIYIPNFGKTKETRLIFVHADGSVLEYDRNTEYEAIFVPNHGRLIDADEAKKKAKMLMADNLTFNIITAAPTIIPAEEGEA